MTNLLPGQTLTNGASNYIFGWNLTNFSTKIVTNSSMQALMKSSGVTNVRCAIPSGSSNAFIDQVANMASACGSALLVILSHSDLTWNKNLVTYLGSRCRMYEFGNEPDINSISSSQYLSLWNQHIPALRAINPNAAFIGPVLGVYANVQSYLVPWLQGCKTSGVLPDAISYHIYPCSGGQNSTTCATLSSHIGNTVPTMNSTVTGILGHTLPMCITEWNIDANNPRQSYTQQASFTQPWETSALDAMVSNGLAMSNLFFSDDMVSSSTGQINIMYQPMADSVKKYLGSGAGSGGTGSISASPTTLSFSATAGGSNPANQTVTLTNNGSASVSYTASTAYTSLGFSPGSGTIAAGGNTTSTISVNTAGLAAGTYQGTVVYTAGGVTATVTVELTLSSGSGTALTGYLAAAASTTLSTANQLYTVANSGTPTNTWTYSLIGTATGYGEVTSQGASSAWAASGSIGTPTGKGFLYESTNLEGQTIAAGNWSALVRLNGAQNGDAASQAGTLTADIIVRAYKRSSGGTYTSIVSMTLAAQTIPAAYTTFTLPATSASSVAFSTGDKLYVDIWLNVTANSNGSAVQDVRLNRESTDTSGHTGDGAAAAIATPGYSATGGGGGSGITSTASSLSFSGQLNGSVASQTTTLTNTTGSTASWTSNISYSSGSGWLSISPTSGSLTASGTQVVTVSPSLTGLGAGTYSASVTFSQGASSVVVTVSLGVTVSNFITRSNSALKSGASTFHGSGPNIYWLGLLDVDEAGALNNNYPSTTEIDDALETAVEMGALVVRSLTLGSSVGNSLSVWPALNAPNSQAFNSIDYAIYKAGQLGLKLIIPLVDGNNSYSGGPATFEAFRSASSGAFFTNSQIISDFEAYISTILNRINQYNQIAYKNDPTILAWETGNKLSSPGATWTTTIANYIKGIDANHLVMDGTVPFASGNLSIASVDLYTNEFFPPNATTVASDAASVSTANKAYFVTGWDWTNLNGGSTTAAFISAIEGASTISGDCFYNLQPHDDLYGFILSSTGYSLYYPGNSGGLQTLSQTLRTHGWTMQGVSVPAAGACEAPTLTSIFASGGGMQIEWQGVPGGTLYGLESASSSGGPYTVVSNSITDYALPYTDSGGTASTWYRVRAFNYSNVAGPYSAPAFSGATAPSGGPTAVVTAIGFNLLRDALSREITYVALGTSNTPAQGTDTQLGNEVFRKAVTSYTNNQTGEVLISMYLSPGDADGVNIQEIGFIGGATASATRGSGVLFARGPYSHNPKSGTESLIFQLDANFIQR